MLILAILAFIAWAIVRFFHPPYTLKHIFLQVVLLIAPPALLVGGLLIGTPTAPTFLRGFERWVLKEVDIDAIQRWLATEGRDYVNRQYDTGEAFPKELPDFLVRFKGHIQVGGLPSGGGPCVIFQWGGPFGHWGLVVGPPDMPMPDEGVIDLSESETEFTRPIKPGVYIFDGG